MMTGWKQIEEGIEIPLPETIAQALKRHQDSLVKTPVWEWHGVEKESLFPDDKNLFLKLELFQHSGSFKPRGVLCVMEQLSPEQLQHGVTCVSAGNHALALSYAARKIGTSAHVVMPKSASTIRVEKVRALGARISLVDDIHIAFDKVREIEEEEKRYFVHPFEGPFTALGTATLGYEFLQQVPELDAIVVPIGGGGLCAGIALAVKQIKPRCHIIGVEPEGADTMRRSILSGKPEKIAKVATIADSLGAPYALPYSFAVCRTFVDEIVTISDKQMKEAMGILFTAAKIAVEPAGAAATAALLSGLAKKLPGQNIGIIVCGSNIDIATFSKMTIQ